MNEDALRAMIRESIARHMAPAGRDTVPAAPLKFVGDASHYRYAMVPQGDGPCLIEPGVQCTHCGYCQSHGH